MPLNMYYDKRAINHRRTQILKCKSVLKKRKFNRITPIYWHNWLFSVLFLILPYLCECQYPTRDPRWYSREGDYNYQWPNPGDPEYRYFFIV